ncbi:MAG: ethylbenzene dehydrogenase-related protein [Candidatus Eisenbacteria bacterium]
MKKVLLPLALLAIPLVYMVLGSGCGEKSTWPAPGYVLESVPTTRAPRVDGNALDREWFSAPELIVALSDGNAPGGGSAYVKMKSVYTALADTVYFLLEWADSTDDVLPDRLIYTGPPWYARRCVTDLSLVDPQYWTKRAQEEQKEDRFCIFFEIVPASDETGPFASRGCAIACHDGMRVPNGRLDGWYWMRARSDPVNRCDDMVVDAVSIRGDPGIGVWSTNKREASFLPRYIARGDNGGLSSAKFVYDQGPYARTFNQCDTINPVTSLPWNDERDLEVDYVPGYMVGNPSGSRGDITAKGMWDEDTGRWSVEIKRAFRTGDETNDIFFYPEAYPNRTYVFAVALMNGSRAVHSGSVPLLLKFRR